MKAISHFGRMIVILVGVAASTTGVFFQQPKKELPDKRAEKKTDESDLALANLITEARQAKPEIEVDVLLTLLSSTLIKAKEQRLELIEEAFRIASKAREPIKRKAWSRLRDTRAGFKKMAYDLDLDKLSIMCRAVRQMISLDKLRARIMFEEIKLPTLDSLKCDDSLGYDTSAYYETLFAVADQCFSAEEKASSTHVDYLIRRLEEIRSVAQLTPALKAILGAKTSTGELAALAHSVSRAVGKIGSNDPRSFAFEVDRQRLVDTAYQMILRLREAGLPTKEFEGTIHSFLVDNLQAETCSDVSWVKNGKASLPSEIESLDKADMFRATFSEDDVRPSNLGPKAVDVVFWTSVDGARLLQMAKRLRFGGGSQQLTLAQRQSEEWHRELTDFLNALEKWDPDHERSYDDYFTQRCNLYGAFVELCPDDLLRDSILRSYLQYLKDSDSKYSGNIEWLAQVKNYFAMVRRRNEPSNDSSLEPVLTSGHSHLRIYGEMARIVSRTKTKS